MSKASARKFLNIFLLSFTFLSLGLLIGLSNGGGSFSNAQETLDTYPVDLSIATLHHHQEHFVQENPPEINVTAHRDEMMPNHFNLEIRTENFRFAPENISEQHVENTGHAHVYVNDALISRSYGNWYHLPRLKPGNHTIRVTLNTNQHDEYSTSEGVVEEEIEVNVPG